MRRTLLSLVLAITIVVMVSLLAGCGGGSTPAPPPVPVPLALNGGAGVESSTPLPIVPGGSANPADYVQEQLVVLPGAAGTLAVQVPFSYGDGLPLVNDTINAGVFVAVWQGGVQLAQARAPIGGAAGTVSLALQAAVAAGQPVTVVLSAQGLVGYPAWSTSRAIQVQLLAPLPGVVAVGLHCGVWLEQCV